jgi:hypothetical protein
LNRNQVSGRWYRVALGAVMSGRTTVSTNIMAGTGNPNAKFRIELTIQDDFEAKNKAHQLVRADTVLVYSLVSVKPP